MYILPLERFLHHLAAAPCPVHNQLHAVVVAVVAAVAVAVAVALFVVAVVVAAVGSCQVLMTMHLMAAPPSSEGRSIF